MATPDSTNPPLPTHLNFRNLTGQTFGRLSVLSYAGRFPHAGKGANLAHWHCQCTCGAIICVRSWLLIGGYTRSCGCLQREEFSMRIRTHGCTRGKITPEYHTWCGIIARCCNPKERGYKYYGGRGIRICDRWRESFAAFLEDMGPRPSPKHSIDRIDNDGHYEPGNCHWVTHKEQCWNRRSNVLVTIDGITKCVAEWCQLNKITPSVAWARVNTLGWSPERAVTLPVRQRRKSV